ncbi:hypothetical protein [Alteromonas sp. C1M14]|uniref:hypothetical protein n=1 Tax=Alteromonas sp. C1M14 TaxID=2841567 RepID=UPI001C081877|nr:hypothetical protein [Alteromonas sp. C1M14]MBU2977190.1 hypothetical protein [Alteromonas sp. C1M14]
MTLLLYIFISGRKPPIAWLSLLMVIAEIIAVNILIAHYGAATNPFAIILLVPLVVGLVLLPLPSATFTLIVSTLAQLFQLSTDSQITQHGMAQHAANMVWGFILTSFLLAAVIGYFRWQLNQQNSAIRQLREQQLRNEQLLAIGTAAAQLTHDAATPIQTISLLLEEFEETQDPTYIKETQDQVDRLTQLLSAWREVADDVRESRITHYHSHELLDALRYSLALARPEAEIDWLIQDENKTLVADRTLLPALTNIVINACENAYSEGHGAVQAATASTAHHWILVLKNPVQNLNQTALNMLGTQLVESDKGAGMGAVLSNATIEKFKGSVTWRIAEGPASPLLETTVTLPVNT